MAKLLTNYDSQYCCDIMERISKLEYNWSGYNTEPFSDKLIDKCRYLLNGLEVKPFVCPCLNGGIQFEYEKDNDDYLEFTILIDKIKYFQYLNNGNDVKSGVVSNKNVIESMNKLIKNFL